MNSRAEIEARDVALFRAAVEACVADHADAVRLYGAGDVPGAIRHVARASVSLGKATALARTSYVLDDCEGYAKTLRAFLDELTAVRS